jgi:hypothetical protein
MIHREAQRQNRALIFFLIILMLLIALSVYGCF